VLQIGGRWGSAGARERRADQTNHRDEVASLPPGAVVLAVNDFGLQAASFTYGRGSFWGVQYHPEYDYSDIAGTAERYGETLVKVTDISGLGSA
jgi:GMP synthase-like glutamine amidotransferase